LALLFTVTVFAAGEKPRSASEAGLMKGFPPPEDRQVTRTNMLYAPYNRWSYQHIRELVPTRNVETGSTVAPLKSRPVDLSGLEVSLPDGRKVNMESWLETAYTDGLVVLQGGEIVFERYYNDQLPSTQHLMFSVTKSFTGTLMLILIEQGRVDANATVASYIPELVKSAFGDATVQQMLNMTNSIVYIEDYFNPDAHITGFLDAMMPGGEGIYSNLQSLTEQDKKFKHGEAFHYVTPDPDVLGWIIRRVTGQSMAGVMHELIWAPLGAEHEGYYWVDDYGTEMAGGGLSITLRDAARFGQMILQDGQYNGRQVLSPAIAKRIKTKRNFEQFNRYYNDSWYEDVTHSYHDQWWGFSGVDAIAAWGIHGQFIYINSESGIVIAKHSSDPEAEGDSTDTDTPLVMHAIAKHLANQVAK
jgi:CubicO group peptidase (beta-lactamase class C family)